MVVSRKKIKYILYELLIIMIELLFIELVNNSEKITQDMAVLLLSFINVFSYLYILYSWKKVSGELLSPYIFFITCLFLFSSGQSIGWLFNIEMGSKDLLHRNDFGLNKSVIISALTYTVLSLSFFYLGSLAAFKSIRNNQRVSEPYAFAELKRISKILLILSVPAFIACSIKNVMLVYNGGYIEIYENTSNYFWKILFYISKYYQPCMFLYLISNKENRIKRNIIIAFMLLDVVSQFYIGGRGSPLMTLCGIALGYHYFVSKFDYKKILQIFFASYILLIIVNAISYSRIEASRELFSFINYIEFNPISEFGKIIGEMGWNLTSLCYTMLLVPKSYSFRYGISYLVSFLAFIPNIGLWSVHPTSKYADLAHWLQDSLGLNYGPGYTMIAEAYINFKWGGLIAIFIFGMIISKLLTKVLYKETKNMPIESCFQIIIIMTLTQSLTRSSLSAAIREIVYVLVPIFLLLKKGMKKTDV